MKKYVLFFFFQILRKTLLFFPIPRALGPGPQSQKGVWEPWAGLLSRLTFFHLSYCPLHEFSFPLRYWLEILYKTLSWHDTDQVVWPTFTSIIVLCKILVFLCSLLRYSHQIASMNLYWHTTERVWLLYPFGIIHVPLWNLLGSVGDMQYLQYACFKESGYFREEDVIRELIPHW